MTKIDVFSGFLGAGKTTLIGKLLKEAYADEKVVLIENEFGEIGIDGGFLKESGIEITEMNSGCICCSLVGDFEKSLSEVLSRFAPDRILIEPSGVGKLSDVVGAVRGVLSDDVVLGSLITVTDASKCKIYMKNFGEFYNNQIENANAIVLSRTDGMREDKLAAAVSLLREHNAHAAIITTPWDALDGAQILAAVAEGNALQKEMAHLADEMAHEECHCHCHGHDHDHDHEHHHHHEHGEKCHCDDHHPHHDHENGEEHDCHHHHENGEECHCHEHEHEHHHEHHHHEHGEECHCHEHHHDHGHHHHADEVFSTFGRETAKVFARGALEEALAALDSEKYGTVLRAKGIVAGEGGIWLHFDYVPGEVRVREGAADVIGRLCVIGSQLDESALATLFGL